MTDDIEYYRGAIRRIKEKITGYEDSAERLKKLKHQDRDKECELIYRGRSMALKTVTNDLKSILSFYDV